MSLQDLKTSTQALTMEEWAEFLGWCVAEERPRREMLQAQEEARTRLIMHLRELGEIPAPDALREPPRHVEDAPEWQHPKSEPQMVNGCVSSRCRSQPHHRKSPNKQTPIKPRNALIAWARRGFCVGAI